MRIGILVGSHRQGSNSAKVGEFAGRRVSELGHEVDIISLAGNPMPLWDQSAWDTTSELTKTWRPFRERLTVCHGLVVISPEWSGMVPAGLKNFFLFCTPREVGHKPALIVGVSSTRGGSYPVAELRMSGYKNNRLCFIPEHVIVRDVEKVFGDGPDSKSEDSEYTRKRLAAAVTLLAGYADALRNLGHEDLFSLKDFPHGM